MSAVFRTFLRLGLTSFGGPAAHLGYFREEFVARRRWLRDDDFASTVALSQFLPGASSSQVGMAIGLGRSGMGGLVAAWIAFTLPSAIIMIGAGYAADAWPASELALVTGAVNGLKAAAVAVVLHAVIQMGRTLTPDLRRLVIAALAAAAVILWPEPWIQVVAVVVGGLLGLAGLRHLQPAAEVSPQRSASPDLAADAPSDAGSVAAGTRFRLMVSRRLAIWSGSILAFLLIVLPLAARSTGDGTLRLIDACVRAGTLVFGGGHVVLPLLESATVPTGMVDSSTFLAGYGTAQALPGPLFSFAAYLGTVSNAGPGGVIGGLIALIAIFLPSALLLIAAIPLWERLRTNRTASRVIAGVCAAVVGLLAAACYDPVMTSGITSWATGVIALVAFILLWTKRFPVWLIVIVAAAAGLATT